MKLTKRKINELILDEIRRFRESGLSEEDIKRSLQEDFTRKEKRELSRLIRNELVKVFYDFYKKRSFWT